MYPPYWGRYYWNILHIISYSSPLKFEPDNICTYTEKLTNILKLIPCPSCRIHALLYLKINPLNDIKTRLDFVSWMNDFHNNVNKRLNKPVYTLQESIEFIEKNFETANKLYQNSIKDKIVKVEDNIKNNKLRITQASKIPIKHAKPTQKLHLTNTIIICSAVYLLILSIIIYSTNKK